MQRSRCIVAVEESIAIIRTVKWYIFQVTRNIKRSDQPVLKYVSTFRSRLSCIYVLRGRRSWWFEIDGKIHVLFEVVPAAAINVSNVWLHEYICDPL